MTSDTIGPDARPQLRQGAELILVADEAVIYETDTGGIHKLDPVATVVCHLLDGHSTVEEVVDTLVETFDEERATIASDVTALVSGLVDKGLFVVAASGAGSRPDGS